MESPEWPESVFCSEVTHVASRQLQDGSWSPELPRLTSVGRVGLEIESSPVASDLMKHPRYRSPSETGHEAQWSFRWMSCWHPWSHRQRARALCPLPALPYVYLYNKTTHKYSTSLNSVSHSSKLFNLKGSWEPQLYMVRNRDQRCRWPGDPKGTPGVCSRGRVVENCALPLWVWSIARGCRQHWPAAHLWGWKQMLCTHFHFSLARQWVTPWTRWDSDTLGTKTGKPPSELNYAICFYS